MNALHFVGFRGSEYQTACLVFGMPDLIHRNNDLRFWSDVGPEDVVVFANGSEARLHERYSFNDSEHF